MTEKDNSRIVAAALLGLSLDQIAEAGGVSRSTVQRRLRDPEVRAAIRDGRSQLKAELYGMLSALNGTAVARLKDLIEDPDPKHAHRGLALWFPAMGRAAAVVDIEERLQDLEAALGDQAFGVDDETGPTGLGN